MPSVAELTEVWGNILLGPRRGPDVCPHCFNFTRGGFEACYACAHGRLCLDAVVPVSYSIAHEQLHHALVGYKRMTGPPARRFTVELAAVLWRFLAAHEKCVATAAGVPRFDIVTTVPSNDRARDEEHPLREIVGRLVAPTRERHRRLLLRSEAELPERTFSEARFDALAALAGESVLLIDDTWTTGANAQSAAAALKSAGADTVGAVVLGRHLNREWHENDQRLRGITSPFSWDACPVCAPAS